MQRFLIIAGIIIMLLGLLWPWLQKLGLFRLPGDIVYEKEGVKFFFPITTSIIISVIITVILWLLRK